MYCPKCGKEVMEGGEFCQNCGMKVSEVLPQTEGSTALAPDAAPAAEKKASKKKIWVIAAAALALMITVGVGAYFLFFSGVKLEGRYSDFLSDSYYYDFSDDGKVIKTPFADISTQTNEGAYKGKSGTVSISWDGENYKESYTVYGEYLIPTDSQYEGEIPKGERFDVVCTKGKNKIEFKKDGTFALSGPNNFGSGTYTRKDDVIHLNPALTSDEPRLFIYNNKIYTRVLYKK